MKAVSVTEHFVTIYQSARSHIPEDVNQANTLFKYEDDIGETYTSTNKVLETWKGLHKEMLHFVLCRTFLQPMIRPTDRATSSYSACLRLGF